MNKEIEAIGSGIRPPLEAKMQYLPLVDLHWGQFEDLCLAIVADKFTIDHCERYGRGGQKQEGIDIFAINSIDDTLSFFQCKKYDKLTVNDLDKIIATFKKGKFYSKSKEFYICCVCSLDDTKIQDKFNFHKTELKKDGISLYKWDLIQISRTLKTKPQIVYDHFGSAIFKAFIGEEYLFSISPLSKEEIKKQLKTASSELSFIDNNFYLPDTHIERKETNDLYQWIITSNQTKEKDERHNISILRGNAGIGKTVILKDLLDILDQNNIPVLGLKADKKRLSIDKPLESILDNINIINLFDHLTTQYPTIVLLVDQIDALSQSLSTNREQIRAYISLINKLSLNQSVKIIISCRTFDLNYDAEFKQYRKNKIFHVGLLDESDIEKVLKKVTKRNLAYFPLSLIELLKTPLHLEVFCRIYNESIVQEIKSLQDLYRELWNQKVKKANSVSHLDFRRVESLLFDIASEIYDRQDNLCAPSMLFDKYYEEVQYLKSVHLIVEDKGNIQFFHQSFYDYTFARDFVEKQNGELYSFILNLSHQGLFIRSMIKQILTYLRIYDPQAYIKELESILFSSDIRYHIKHLIVNHLSFEEKPTYKEKQIMLDLIEKIPTLATTFFLANSRTINRGWHNLFLDEKELLIRLLNNPTNELGEAVKRFVVFSVNLNVEDTLNLLLNIEDEIERYSTIDWTLIRLNDFIAPLTNELFDELNDKYLKRDQQRFHILDQAIISNPEFAISRAKNIFERNISIKRENFRLSLYSDEFSHFCDFCEKLHKYHPNKAYFFTKDIINMLISKTIQKHYIEDYYLDEDYAFEKYDPGHVNEYHKLLKYNIDYLNSQTKINLEFVKEEITILLSSKLATNHLIVYHILSESPQLFLSEIFILLTDEQICESSLDINDLAYHYREIWRKSYPLFDLEKQNKLNHFILSFHPKSTLRKDKSFLEMRKKYGTYQRYTKEYPYPFWGRDQQLLLHSIPNEYIDLNKNLRRRKGELDRRFSGEGWSCKNEKPCHSITAGSFYGGLTSEAKYERLTISQWNSSFLVYNTHKDSCKRKLFDLDAHANHFRDAVKKNANHFSVFVTDLIEQNKVNIKYQINGLEGLMLGAYQKYEILILYKKLISCSMEEREQYSFLRLSNYFIEENIIDDTIVEYWKDYLIVPLAERSGYWDNTDKKHPLFSKGQTSINAISINLLIKSLSIVKYSKSIYNYLLEISSQLPIELKLVMLYEFSNSQNKILSDKQSLEIFLIYSSEINSEIFLVSQNLINYLFYRCFDQLIPFIEKTKDLQKTEKFYGIHLLYAWFYGNEVAKDLLFQVHQKYPASIRASIREACRYLENDEYQQKCLHILDMYSSDTRKDIREAYQQNFYKLNPKNFEIVSPIIKKFINDNNEERQLYNLYRYLTDCTTIHYIECIEILRLIDYDKLSKGRKEIEEPIKLLTICYNTVKKYDKPDINLEYAMDIFDRILHFTSYDTNIDKMLIKLDSE